MPPEAGPRWCARDSLKATAWRPFFGPVAGLWRLSVEVGTDPRVAEASGDGSRALRVQSLSLRSFRKTYAQLDELIVLAIQPFLGPVEHFLLLGEQENLLSRAHRVQEF